MTNVDRYEDEVDHDSIRATRAVELFLDRLGLADRRAELHGTNPHLLPKTATVVEVREPHIFPYRVGESMTLRGSKNVENRHALLGQRTVYLPDPVTLDGEPHYLQVKGYGCSGKWLYGGLHSEGDVFFGMFMDAVEREHRYADVAQELGLDAQRPVAMLQYETDEWVRMALVSVLESVSGELRRDHEYGESYEQAVVMVGDCYARFQSDGRAGIAAWADEHPEYRPDVAALLDGREAGYVIRAVRRPGRVGDLHDERIVTEYNKAIAVKMGEHARVLLEHGFWNLSPNPGNWTIDGQLVDFEDVVDVRRDHEEIRRDQAFRGFTSLEEHCAFSFGSGSVGLLSPEFKHGFAGRPSSDEAIGEIAANIIRSLE